MASTGDLTEPQWMAMRDLQRDGEYDIHWRTAQALIERGLARKKSVAANGRWVCKITAKGKEYGRKNDPHPTRWYPRS
jgi:hypothetical protein